MADPAPSPGPDLKPACEQCGYELVGAAGSICPECGTPFDPAHPWRPEARPRAWRLALRSVGPMVLVLVALLAASALAKNLLVWPLWSVWIVAIVACMLFVPLTVAKASARATEPRLSRRAGANRVWMAAVIVNVVATVLAMLAFIAML